MSQINSCYGAIEAGGTKFICAIGDETGQILDEARIDTGEPATTLARVILYFIAAKPGFGTLRAVGVGSFGPLDLRPVSPTFGYITTTPKPGWAQTDLLGTLRRGLGRPVYLDTDVNAAALAERRWGAGRQLESLAYVTVGTGIGGGILHRGRPIHGLMHPEIGHIFVRRHPADSDFAGICPFHGDCLEGLASGPAIVARLGHSLNEARPDDLMWDIEADYLGQLCAQLVLMHSPQRILMGGGVMQQERLLVGIRERMRHWLGGCVALAELADPYYLCAPGLGISAGIKGALAVALDAGG